MKRKPRHLPAIDLSALTGTAVMLLLVCMTARAVESVGGHGWGVDLARTATAKTEPLAARDNAIKITVSRDGRVFFGPNQVGAGDLPEKIESAVNQGAERRVYLRVDSRAHYGDVKAVEDQIRSAGIWQICFLAEKTAK